METNSASRYQALYRRFRPSAFSEVRGQDAVITTLRNQVRAGRLGHAYLFTGTRGTGKTTVAKILARAANCEDLQDGDPCGKCEACRRILNGANLNVVEMDAASNNGVDSVREIVSNVAYPPAEGRYKVYIIDEVHMLSTAAFNALLKTLEEPPEYVIFILATTEVHKLPVTILSRCQRYDFRRIGRDVIAGQLKAIAEEEKLQIEQKAIDYLAAMGDGSMRDALSLMERCIDYHAGQGLTYDMALEVLGAVDTRVYSRLFRAVRERDVAACMGLVNEALLSGREITRYTSDFLWYLRNLLLLSTAGDGIAEAVDISTEAMERLKEDGKLADTGDLIRYIRIFSALSDDLRFSTQKRVQLEVALIRLCEPRMERDEESLLARLSLLEKQLKELSERPVTQKAVQVLKPEGAEAQGAPAEKKERPKLKKAPPEAVKKLAENWGRAVDAFPEWFKFYLKKGQCGIDPEGRLTLAYSGDDKMSLPKVQERREDVEKKLSEYIGGEVELNILILGENESLEDHCVSTEELFLERVSDMGGDLTGVDIVSE